MAVDMTTRNVTAAIRGSTTTWLLSLVLMLLLLEHGAASNSNGVVLRLGLFAVVLIVVLLSPVKVSSLLSFCLDFEIFLWIIFSCNIQMSSPVASFFFLPLVILLARRNGGDDCSLMRWIEGKAAHPIIVFHLTVCFTGTLRFIKEKILGLNLRVPDGVLVFSLIFRNSKIPLMDDDRRAMTMRNENTSRMKEHVGNTTYTRTP
jgi:hypothetical protein